MSETQKLKNLPKQPMVEMPWANLLGILRYLRPNSILPGARRMYLLQVAGLNMDPASVKTIKVPVPMRVLSMTAYLTRLKVLFPNLEEVIDTGAKSIPIFNGQSEIEFSDDVSPELVEKIMRGMANDYES